jgi:Predicted outer membrane protein
MGKNLRSFLAFFVATLGALIMIFSSQGLTVKATDYQTNDLLSDFTIAQKDYGTASNVETTFYWDATGKNLQNGDTWTIDLPDTLKVKNPGETIPLYDKNNNLIGNAVLNSDNTIKVTFTDVEGKNDFSGSITVGTGIGVGKDAVIGDNNVIIGDKNQNMTVTLSDSDISKKGVIGTDENGDPVITWTILVNRNSEDLQNLSVSDHLRV